MKFDHAHAADYSSLPAATAALMRAKVLARRAERLAIQFTNEAGARDEWAFASIKNRDDFAAGLAKRGIDFVISQ